MQRAVKSNTLVWLKSQCIYSPVMGAYQFMQKCGAASFIEGGSACSALAAHSFWSCPPIILLLILWHWCLWKCCMTALKQIWFTDVTPNDCIRFYRKCGYDRKIKKQKKRGGKQKVLSFINKFVLNWTTSLQESEITEENKQLPKYATTQLQKII